MSEPADITLTAPASGRIWFRFLMVLGVLVAVGLGVLVVAVPGQTAPGRYGEQLKFEPPPVDLDFNSDGANSETATPARQQGPQPAEQSRNQGTTQKPQAQSGGAQGQAAGGSTGGKPKSVRLFGTAEFRSVIKDLPKWERVLNLEKQKPSFGSDRSRMPANVVPRWEKLAAELAGKPLKEQAQKVNNFFNQWPYKTDMAVWGVEDYWAVPAEFMQKSGDCEDYAISKYYALRELGVPANKMRIVIIVDSIRNLGHAVLVVYYDDNAYVLDNLTNLVLSHQRLTHYVPQFSINEEYLWRHVQPVKK